MICQHCGTEFDRAATMGPVPKWCSTACRQAAYHARHRTERRIARAVATLEAAGYEVRAP